jgi:LysR family transcriptional regulator, glycine cleavage system transcriptional activator
VFVAVAHSLNFTRAAESLGVSPGAASLQIRALEDYLGRPLFRRNGREVVLTTEGSALLPRVQTALESLEQAIDETRAHHNVRLLRVTTLSSFLQQWLLPRLPLFQARWPLVDLHFHSSTQLVDFVRDEYHAAIRFGRGPWPGLHAEKLLDEWLVPVCAPALLQRLGALQDMKDLRRYPLLHSTTEPWTHWLLGETVPGQGEQISGATFDDSLAVVHMATRGRGLALARWALIADEIESGTLVAAAPAIRFTRQYWFVCPERLREVAPVKALAQWLAEEAAKFPMPPSQSCGSSADAPSKTQ